jgi:hypothetical protein
MCSREGGTTSGMLSLGRIETEAGVGGEVGLPWEDSNANGFPFSSTPRALEQKTRSIGRMKWESRLEERQVCEEGSTCTSRSAPAATSTPSP